MKREKIKNYIIWILIILAIVLLFLLLWGYKKTEDSSEVFNRVPTFSSISLSSYSVGKNFFITVSANSEEDLDNGALFLYCCRGLNCVPSIYNHDFCFDRDEVPYDLFCRGNSGTEEGYKIINCRLYDGEDYSEVRSERYLVYSSDEVPNGASELIPNDAYKFYHKNSANENVAWFGSEGNIVLKGSCISGGTCITSEDSFIVKDSSDNTVAYIDSDGNMCLESGDCSDENANCDSPFRNSFIVKDSSDNNVIYIDSNGNLCLIGKLYENSEP